MASRRHATLSHAIATTRSHRAGRADSRRGLRLPRDAGRRPAAARRVGGGVGGPGRDAPGGLGRRFSSSEAPRPGPRRRGAGDAPGGAEALICCCHGCCHGVLLNFKLQTRRMAEGANNVTNLYLSYCKQSGCGSPESNLNPENPYRRPLSTARVGAAWCPYLALLLNVSTRGSRPTSDGCLPVVS